MNGRMSRPISVSAVIRIRRNNCSDGAHVLGLLLHVLWRLPVDDDCRDRIIVLIASGLDHLRGERNFEALHATALLAHGEPSILDAPFISRSAKVARIVSAAPSFALDPRVPVSMTLPK